MNEQPSDIELIDRCLNHDEAAWELIISRYKRKVFGIAYKFTGRFEEAEDLTQEVFFKVYKALHSYKKEQDFSWWLVSISRNACIDYYRSVKRERKILSGDVNDLKNFKFQGLTPQGNMEAAERARSVRQSLSELPEDLRHVLILRDLQGLSYKEIADQLNLAEGTVKSRIHRGRAELADRIKGLPAIEKHA
ncbi:MAG TPA: sigma-70 family RNA polymerase sigma factor [Acidobacteriota bacterium]|nr:sigma-70 family RNA polymerase sigma factor [Acidobacteriota bacterium]